ncbi:MAG: response regulator transcription factor [Chitinophagaceae bacterium]|nr:response regulator transcription factor [Chitinophagaceae bacterium]
MKTPIAIVDDHTLFRQGLASLINSSPVYEVCLDCSDGLALEHLLPSAETKPKILLLDIMMKHKNGYETAVWLRNNYPDILILTLSTMDHEMSIIRMIRHGARGYILKDADTEELFTAFTSLLDEGYYYNELVTQKIVKGLHNSIHVNENETRFLQLACNDMSYQQIAEAMHKSEKTVDGYRADLFKKFQVTSRVGMVLYAIRAGLVNWQ